MNCRILAVGTIFAILISAGCVGSGPVADFVNGRMFTKKAAASDNASTTIASTAASSTLTDATTSSTSSTNPTIPDGTATAITFPRNLTCDRKWGQLARDQCYLDFGIGLADVRICENLTYRSLREICYYSIGTETGNLSACNMVEDDIKRKKCFDTVQQT